MLARTVLLLGQTLSELWSLLYGCKETKRPAILLSLFLFLVCLFLLLTCVIFLNLLA